MIAKIHGTILKKLAESVIVMTNDIAYQVSIPERDIRQLAIDEQVELWTILNLGENDIRLYGFQTFEERDTFSMLTSISGVGPKMALGVLSTATPSEIKNAIRNSNTALFKSVSGIGTKNANRIIVELQNKVGEADDDVAQTAHERSEETDEIYAALKNLGYTKKEVQETLRKVDPDLSTDKKIREILKRLGS